MQQQNQKGPITENCSKVLNAFKTKEKPQKSIKYVFFKRSNVLMNVSPSIILIYYKPVCDSQSADLMPISVYWEKLEWTLQSTLCNWDPVFNNSWNRSQTAEKLSSLQPKYFLPQMYHKPGALDFFSEKQLQ